MRTLRDRLAAHGVRPETVHERVLDRVTAAADASHYLLQPQALVTTSAEADVVRLLAACTAERLPLTFRSGGTSLSGQAGTHGVLADVRRGFRGVEVLDGGARVRVAPGTTVRAVNAALAPHGRRLGPDPASDGACTIGGVVADNSSGMSCGVEGTSYHTLDSLRVVLPSGTVVDTALPDADARLAHDEPALHAGLARLRDALRASPGLVAEVRRQFSVKNTMGYGLNSLLDHDEPAQVLAHLVVGSEGTLAFVSSATFRTLPVRPFAATGLLVVDELSRATDALPALVGSGAVALELLDTRSLHVAAGDARATPGLRALRLERQAALLVEYQAESADELAALVEQGAPVLATGVGGDPLTSDPAARADLWHLRKGLYAAVAGARRRGTTALLEDVAVPVADLTATCAALDDVFAAHGYDDAVVFGHAKDGNIHFMISEDLGEAAGQERYARFTDDMVDVVLARGGTLKAEHGTGRVMAPFVRRQYGDDLYAVMLEVKAFCDPSGVLNPGVLLSDDPQAHLRDLKSVPEVEEEVDACVECGFCEPVCPSRDLTLTPRQRIIARRAEAGLRAAAAAGDDEAAARADELAADYDYAGVQTCAVDSMCQTACPVSIDTGQLVRRLRAQEQGRLAQAVGRTAARHWAGATRAAGAALDVARRAPGLTEAASRGGRRVLGEDRVPLYAGPMPGGGSRRAPSAGAPTPAARTDAAPPAVVLLPSCTGAMFGSPTDGGAHAAFLALCERAGVEVRVPADADTLCCGMPWSSKGLTAGAAEMSRRLVASLADLTERGRVPVLTDSASCSEGLAKSLRGEGLGVEDAVSFAARELLPRLAATPVARRLALHPTCASTRAGHDADLRALAAAVAEEVFVPPSWGCCAFAGDRGLLHPELTEAATAAQAAEVRAAGADAHASCNRTCELGMTRATGETYENVLVLLERATRVDGAGA
ncbi:FAD-binding and (Fe-S)-binding domain-containing protein [Nocardioides bruguierae]|uniref:FAD-binding and (Fe-S)-binding domain-containing protein n=1 Tax=Nocardioides bruguierae TaxID=2945102 RepID=UPI002020DF48|nr:FAD-binding and (Fe-S)-binding domain-containing protein [Nocardioides bruguierae]MCL8026864.1 FAD-binding oxidoreductase [Nocardioides bruguierae]